MARVTVEDCVGKVDSWFELVMLAAHRSRAIANGAPITVAKDGDKPTVIALREIAAQTVEPEELRQSFVRSMQKIAESERVNEAIQSFLDKEAPIEDYDLGNMSIMRFEDETFDIAEDDEDDDLDDSAVMPAAPDAAIDLPQDAFEDDESAS